MIALFTDFGADDVYVGQVKAALERCAPGVPVVDLLHRAPDFDVLSSAHLLDALYRHFDRGSVFFSVVDPGVGGPRQGLVVRAEGRWFIGPDNGLLGVIVARAAAPEIWQIQWRPEALSASFHGRDLFAPVAGWIAAGAFPNEKLARIAHLQVPGSDEDLARVIYVDHYGNCFTGLRAGAVDRHACLVAAGMSLKFARTFCEAPANSPFWYENSVGLVEIAADRRAASALLGLAVGDAISWQK